MNDQQEKLATIEFDIDDETKPAMVALGIRLALLQGIYDCTFDEIFGVVEENFGYRKVVVDEK